MLNYTKVYPVANTPPAPRKIINKKPRPKQNPYTYPYPYTHTYTYSYNIHIYICIYIYIYTHTCTQAYTHILNKLYKSNLNPTSVTPGWPQWPTEVGHCSKGWTPKMKPKACFLLIFTAFSMMGLAPFLFKILSKYSAITENTVKNKLNPTSLAPGWTQWPTAVGHCSRGWTPKMKPKACFLLIFTAFWELGMSPIFDENHVTKSRLLRNHWFLQHSECVFWSSPDAMTNCSWSLQTGASKPLVFTDRNGQRKLVIAAPVAKTLIFTAFRVRR